MILQATGLQNHPTVGVSPGLQAGSGPKSLGHLTHGLMAHSYEFLQHSCPRA